MPPKGPRKQFRRGEVVRVAGDANNEAFKAINTRKRASTKLHPSIEQETIEIDSDDETSHPPKKSRPGKLNFSFYNCYSKTANYILLIA